MISNENLLVLGATQRKPSSKPYSAALVHGLTRRDQNQCTGKNPDGLRCENKRWLDFHHIIPRSHGGKDTLENMTTLCRAHHQMYHARAEHSSNG
jgi:5-methylcytosine-specific restriction endonuclease McrA